MLNAEKGYILVPYPFEEAVRVARNNQRPDWAERLATGRAC